MIIAIALVPVFVFLLLLFFLDSFKLVSLPSLIFSFIMGCFSAMVALVISLSVQTYFSIDFEIFSKYISPFTEEILKASIVLTLFKRKKIGFLIDAGIYGFAIGAGFSMAENIYFLMTLSDPNLLIWILRGLGTSLMHCGTTSILAIIIMGALSLNKKIISGFLPGFLFAYVIHSAFNHFYIQPITQVLIVAFGIPTLLIGIFKMNEKQLRNWLEIELFSEAEMLIMIRKGHFSSTKAGLYLSSLKNYFSKEVIVDMYCFVQLYLELSIAVKRNILLRESEFPEIVAENLSDNLQELRQLRKSIGKSGELALAPLIKLDQRSLWKLSSLKY